MGKDAELESAYFLTFQIADRFAQGLAETGHDYEILDLHGIGLAGVSEEQMKKRNYDEMITHLLNVGIADYCGVSNSKVEFLYETLDSTPKHYEMLLTKLIT